MEYEEHGSDAEKSEEVGSSQLGSTVSRSSELVASETNVQN